MAQDGAVCQNCLATVPVESGTSKQEAIKQHNEETHMTPPPESAKGSEAEALVGAWSATLGDK